MPKYFGGTHVTQMIHGQEVAKRLRGDKLYYQAFLDVGFVMWKGPNGFISSYTDIEGAPNLASPDPNSSLLVNQSVPLSQSITKLKTGLIVNVSSKVIGYYPQDVGNDWSTPDASASPINATILSGQVSLADLQNRVAVKIATAEYEVYVQAIDDTHLTFTSYRGTMANSDRVSNTSTLISSFNGGVDYLIIDSITAY